MQIRNKLTFQFIGIVAVILLFGSLAVYFFSAEYRRDDFYNRLSNKANTTAHLLIEVDEVDANLLKRIEENNPLSLPNEVIQIYDHENKLIYGSDEAEVFVSDTSLLNRTRREDRIEFRQNEYEVLTYVLKNQNEEFVLLAAAVDIYGVRKLQNLRTVLLIVFVLSILLTFFAGYLYSGKALKPINKVIDQVDNIGISSISLRVDEGNGQDEIAKLASTFNNMLDRLELAFKMQKNFIANASHELRTPLTAITGQLEVQLSQDRDAESYKKVLQSVLEDMLNLSNTSNRLLLLAQTTAENAETIFEPVRIDDHIWSARMELLKRDDQNKIEVEFDEEVSDERQLTVLGNALLLRTAILNLIENGCKYSEDHSVKVRIRPAGRDIEISFTDQGIGIEEKDIQTIFEPFHRGSNAMTVKGHGLGLSLVDRIVRLHHGSISLDSTPGKGSVFTLLLPVHKF